jgi:hypothetical protein
VRNKRAHVERALSGPDFNLTQDSFPQVPHPQFRPMRGAVPTEFSAQWEGMTAEMIILPGAETFFVVSARFFLFCRRAGPRINN